MTRFGRELPDEAYSLGMLYPSTVLRNIDEKTAKAIAETGGAYGSTTPIVIRGAGIELQAGALIRQGAFAKPSAGNNYVFGDDDYFQFPEFDRSILNLAIDFFPTALTMPIGCRLVRPFTTSSALFSRRLNQRFLIPIRTIDQTRIVEVKVGFGVPAMPTLPIASDLPRCRLVRIDAAGNVTQHPVTNADTPDGWKIATRITDAGEWYNLSDPHFITIEADPIDGPKVDRTTYDYAVEWWEKRQPETHTRENGSFIYNIKTTFRSNAHFPY